MALNNLEDRLESAIRHINTSLDIDPWAQNLAVESIIMRIDLLKNGYTEIIHCRNCKYSIDEYNDGDCYCKKPHKALEWIGDWNFFCASAERRTDG